MLKPNLKITMVADNSRDLERSLRNLIEQDVLVGIPAEKAARTSEEARARGTPITNAALGYIHEHGSPPVNIPPRPFLIPGIKNAQKEISEGFEKAGAAALEGKPDVMVKQLHAIGLRAATSVKLKIQSGPFVALKPATIRARRRRGHMGTKPLIDTGQLRNAVTYVLRRRTR